MTEKHPVFTRNSDDLFEQMALGVNVRPAA